MMSQRALTGSRALSASLLAVLAALAMVGAAPGAQLGLGFVQLCKVAGPGVTVGTVFTFTAGTATVPVTAGPGPAGTCATRFSVSPGSITIKETVPAGVHVTAIGVSPIGALVSFDTSTATAVVLVAETVTTTVTYTNAAIATAATLRSFTVTRSGGAYTARWRTASELDLIGFNVYGLVGSRRVKLNRALIAARGGNNGARYVFRYRPAVFKRPNAFVLEAVALDGSRASYGPTRLR